jgi:hypothetical protein
MYNITRIKLTEFQRQTLAYLLFTATKDGEIHATPEEDAFIDISEPFSINEVEALMQVSKKVEKKAKLSELVK